MPSATLNRPKRSEEMWETLKVYIIKQRQKKKQEQEADEEVERQRKERERQQKQDVMTLGETREQILQLEMRLKELKDEKHQLFLQLKKVLNEDVQPPQTTSLEAGEWSRADSISILQLLGSTHDLDLLANSKEGVAGNAHILLEAGKEIGLEGNAENTNDMMSLHGYPAVAISGHPQLFLQQSIPLAGRAPIYKVAPQHTLLPPVR
ncbi:unnamed protein product, partial [Timema podura]|nr:unnamed protein product [Timema podura]